MQRIEPAKRVSVWFHSFGSEVHFPYNIDDRFQGTLKVVYPFPLDQEAAGLLPSIAVGVAAFLGQLCLARQIILEFPVASVLVENVLPLVEMLYDVRCWWDQLDLMPLPEFTRAGGDCPLSRFTSDRTRHACLLWSGGKDSALSTILLRRNGFSIHPVHFTVNARVESSEAEAASSLGAFFHLAYDEIAYEFPQFLEISREYARKWDSYPHYNPVPFGRDLVVALLATIVAQRNGATYLCLGHEHDERSEYFEYQGKRIARCEIESSEGERLTERYVHQTISPTLKFFPPVGALSEFRTLHEMFTRYPELMSRVSFCFWGTACGRCSKCLRYYLVERALGKEGAIDFQANPLQAENCPDLVDYLGSWQSTDSALYRDEIFYCMARLVERQDIRPGEHLLERFASEIYPSMCENLDQLEEQLMREDRDDQIPPEFVYD